MQRSLKRIIVGAIFFTVTNVVAVFGYMSAGWTFLDATYMVVITIFGVGFGEVRPMTPQLRVFTIGVIVAGTSSAVYAVGGFVQLLAEGEIRRALGARRMEHGISSLSNHVVLCGYGHVGEILAVKLSEAQQPFVVIELNADLANQAESLGYYVRCGNATDEAVLLSAGVERARVLVTALADDVANVFITLTARGLNPGLQIMARGSAPSVEQKLRLAGADHIVLPAAIGAQRMAHMITHPAAISFLNQIDSTSFLNEQLAPLALQINEIHLDAKSPLIGRTISDLEVKGRSHCIVVALRHTDGSFTPQPDPALVVQAGDTIMVLGRPDALPQLTAYYAMQNTAQFRGTKL